MPLDSNHPSPKVSVGILTRNAGPLMQRVMGALGAQRTPWPFEVVVLDSASRDGTDALAARHGARVIPYRPAQFRFGPARDTLFENCRGEVLVTISQDVVPADDLWLQKLTEPVIEGQADAVVGEQAPPLGTYSFYWDYHGSWMRTVAVAFDQAHGRIAISCANLAIARAVWQKLRFGDCQTIEDRVMQVKLFQGGYRMLKVTEALSYHGHDYTWKELSGRISSFAMGWARLGWPYTLRHLLRDLVQPSRWQQPLEAFLGRKLASWKELIYPLAMCWMQYRGSRKA
jgi:rhamnosyltransferase